MNHNLMKKHYEIEDKSFLILRVMDGQDDNGHRKEKQLQNKEQLLILGGQNNRVLQICILPTIFFVTRS